VVLSEAHTLSEEDALIRFRRRVADLDGRLAEVEEAVADVEERGVPEPFWIAADYNRAQLAAEREWLTTVIKRIESKDLSWRHRKNK
jgi:hypothetical protein